MFNKEIQIQLKSTNSVITNINCITFLGLSIDTTLSWKEHVTLLSSRLSKACYALRAIKPFMSIDLMSQFNIPMHMPFYLMISFSGVILISVTVSLKSKKE
jgi:hypothetical protein